MVTREPQPATSKVALELEARAGRRSRTSGPRRRAAPSGLDVAVLEELAVQPRQAILAQRSRVHLGTRLVSRLSVLAHEPSLRTVRSRMALAGVAVDVIGGVALRRDSRPLLGLRTV